MYFKLIIIALIFLSYLPTFGQSLECCNTIDEIENVLEGSWLLTSKKELKRVDFKINEGKGITQMFSKNEDKWQEIDNSFAPIKIIQENEVFFIMYDRLGLKINSLIKELTRSKLVLERSDGKQSVLTKHTIESSH